MNPLFYFVLALTSVSAANAFVGPIFDTDNNMIYGNSSYYVLPVIRGNGGGVTLAGSEYQVCLRDIVQEFSEVDEGLPVKFSNWRSKHKYVPEQDDLNIETQVTATICSQGTYWQLGEFDQKSKKYFVVIGSKPEGDGEDSSKTFFRLINVQENDYKILFCARGLICSNVGIFVDEKGVRRLVLSIDPFLVKFKKANVTTLSTKTM